jgi:two-component system, chemotaxis family, chemotaxis protein CheY
MTNHKPLRVLIVEDDKTSRIVLRRILETLGDQEIYEAEDGLKAWEMLNGGLVPQLCFLDLNMPRMNGIELLRRIRGDRRFASLRACFCSAVRDRNLIVQAAVLQPDSYILKPYDRNAIHAQVRKVQGTARPEESLESAADVCARLGIDPAIYDSRLNALLEDVRTLTIRLPTLLMRLDVAGAFSALDSTRQAAQALGVRRIFKLADGLSRSLKSDVSLADPRVASKEETAAKPQQWLSCRADLLMQTTHDMRVELQTVERLATEARLGPQATKDAPDSFMSRQRAELDGLICFLSEVFRRGKLLAASKSIRSKSLNVPVKASFLGQDSAQTVGALTRRISFSLTILDAETADAIESCRKINDLVKLLSFPLDASARWMPDAAIGLLERELNARNDQGVMLLRQAIGPDFEAFMRRQEVIVRENLTRLYQQAESSGGASEEQVQDILQDVRGRLQPGLDGELTAHPVFSELDLGNLAERIDDARWASPYSLLHHAALLFRTAVTDPGFDRAFKFSTFDRQTFLETMNVFGDPIANHPDPERAARETEQLEAIAASPVSLLEKCRLVWGIMKGVAESGVSLLELDRIKLQLENPPERGGDSLSPQIPAPSAGDKLSPTRSAVFEAALPPEVRMEASGLVSNQSGVGHSP